MVVSGIIDTSVVIDYLRQHIPAQNWFLSQGKAQLAITPIVWLETVQGARNTTERDRAIAFLKRFHMVHPIPADNEWAMEQVARYWLSHGIQYADVMIASVAVRMGVPIYTTNLKHYAPLPGVNEQRPY